MKKELKYISWSLMFLMSACGGLSQCWSKNKNIKDIESSIIRIVLTDSLSVKYEGERRILPENLQNLCFVLSSESRDCNRSYILEPNLIRLDQNQEFSLKTNIEKGGSKDVTNPKVIGKLIKKNFEELDIPKSFLSKRVTNTDLSKMISDFLNTKGANDSIMVYSEEGSLNSYKENGRKFRIFSDVEELRTQILSILCQNEKANFTILFNPPITELSIKPTEKVLPVERVSEKPTTESNVKQPDKPTKPFKGQNNVKRPPRDLGLPDKPRTTNNAPDYLKKTVQQVKDEGLIKKEEIKQKKQDK